MTKRFEAKKKRNLFYVNNADTLVFFCALFLRFYYEMHCVISVLQKINNVWRPMFGEFYVQNQKKNRNDSKIILLLVRAIKPCAIFFMIQHKCCL